MKRGMLFITICALGLLAAPAVAGPGDRPNIRKITAGPICVAGCPDGQILEVKAKIDRARVVEIKVGSDAERARLRFEDGRPLFWEARYDDIVFTGGRRCFDIRVIAMNFAGRTTKQARRCITFNP